MADAENILAEAWVRLLIGVRDRRQAKARGAAVQCERARRELDAALAQRAPGPIAAAHADLEQTLLAADAAHDLYAQARRRVDVELEQLWWRSVQRTVEACIARGGPPQLDGKGNQPVDPLPGPASRSLLVRLPRRLVTWVLAARTRA